jgi:hypothetical protein
MPQSHSIPLNSKRTNTYPYSITPFFSASATTMRLQLLFPLLWLAGSAISKLLVDYNADRGDDVSKIGFLNLEQARGDKIKENTDDLYIKAGKDWRGSKAAHFHRKKGYIRCVILAKRFELQH